jgi:hypothetical protein
VAHCDPEPSRERKRKYPRNQDSPRRGLLRCALANYSRRRWSSPYSSCSLAPRTHIRAARTRRDATRITGLATTIAMGTKPRPRLENRFVTSSMVRAGVATREARVTTSSQNTADTARPSSGYHVTFPLERHGASRASRTASHCALTASGGSGPAGGVTVISHRVRFHSLADVADVMPMT